MNKGKVFLLISVLLALVVSSCTTYTYTPNNTITGDVVSGNDAPVEVPVELGNLSEGENKTEAAVNDVEPVENKTEGSPDVVVFEGELVDLKPLVVDPDGDNITLGFTSPFDEKGTWQTKEGDAGLYSIIITASDNKDASFVTKQMVVNVLVKNKAPQIEISENLEFNEGDMIVLTPNVTDEDSQDIFVTYTGWMTSKTYQSTYEDAGTHEVTLVADDGKTRAFKKVNIIVKDVDREPVVSLSVEGKLTVTEGELAEIDANATDPDGQSVSLTFSEPMSPSGKWSTKKGDAGNYTVKISASDGVNEVTQEIQVEVMKKNNAPVIDSVIAVPEFVILKKPGDSVTVKLEVVASDPDDDELKVTFTGDMDAAERTFNYGEKGGTKTVTVTVSDGQESASKDVTFEMNNWPCFDCKA